MKTLSDLKRDSKNGKLYGEMVVRCGTNDIPDRLKGKRQIVDANTVAIFFLNNEGKKSELRIERASLLEYTNDFLTIYDSGFRKLNEQEQRVMDEWVKIENTPENIEQSKTDMLIDGSQMYYKKLKFFREKDFSYLCGFDEQRGLKYDFNTKMIRDKNIKGNISMQYKLFFESVQS